jgi:Ion transport protein
MQLAIKNKLSHAASLILKVVARSWSSVIATDAIFMPDLLNMLGAFPALVVPFLTDQIKLVQVSRFAEIRYGSHLVTAAASSEAWTNRNEMIEILDKFHAYSFLTRIVTHAVLRIRSEYNLNVMQHVIPVRGCNTIEVVDTALDIAEKQQNTLLFKSEVIAAVTDLHWSLYGKADHMFRLTMYVLLLVLFTLLKVMFDTWVSSTKLWQRGIGWTLQAIKCIMFTCYFVWQESRELRYEGFAVWVRDAWNIMDVTAYSLVYAGVIVQACSHPEQPAQSKAANIINAVAAVLLWFKLLHYMRSYKATGILGSMILTILMELKSFMLVLAIVVVGFATAFYSILDTDKVSSSTDDTALKYNTVGAALRTSFAYMLGDYELAVLDAGPSDVMLSILWVVFTVIVTILLLNILIAIISYKFAKLYETGEDSYMLERTKAVKLSYIKLSEKRRDQLNKYLRDKPYVVVFKPYVDAEETADRWADRIDRMTTAVTKAVQDDINSMKIDVLQSLELRHDEFRRNASDGQVDVNALKKEVSDLKSVIAEMLNVVKVTAQQTSASTSVSTGPSVSDSIAPTPLTPSTTAAAAAAAAQEEPITVVTTTLAVSHVDETMA